MGQTQHMFDCCCSCMEVLNYSSGHIFMVHMHVWCIRRLYISRDCSFIRKFHYAYVILWTARNVDELWLSASIFARGVQRHPRPATQMRQGFLWRILRRRGCLGGQKKWNLGRTKFSWCFFSKMRCHLYKHLQFQNFPRGDTPRPL